MIKNGISVPDTEGWLGKDDAHTFQSYQLREYLEAVAHVKKRRVAIDCGAHVGIMSYRMAKDFEHVHSIEPLFGEHLRYNTREFSNITYHDWPAHSEPNVTLHMRKGLHHSAGSNVIMDAGIHTADLVTSNTIDSLNLTNVDFLKIDVEGWEWFAIQGADKTIRENKPTILMEMHFVNNKPENHYAKEILDYFTREIGYTSIQLRMDMIFYIPEENKGII